MGLSFDHKKYITRYITLNQPCSLSDLTREFCYSDQGPLLDIYELYRYLYVTYISGDISFIPNIFENEFKYLSTQYSIDNLLKKQIDAKIIIPDHFVKVWKNWVTKYILNPDK